MAAPTQSVVVQGGNVAEPAEDCAWAGCINNTSKQHALAVPEKARLAGCPLDALEGQKTSDMVLGCDDGACL